MGGRSVDLNTNTMPYAFYAMPILKMVVAVAVAVVASVHLLVVDTRTAHVAE